MQPMIRNRMLLAGARSIPAIGSTLFEFLRLVAQENSGHLSRFTQADSETGDRGVMGCALRTNDSV